jgi:hypothetical protein
MEKRNLQQGSSTQVPREFGHLFETKGFTVLDLNQEKIGKVDDIYVGGDQHPRYLGVKMGFFGQKMTFIPVQLVKQVDVNQKSILLSIPKDVAKSGPVFERDHAFTSEDEALIWKYYGLGEPVYVVTEIFLWREAS